MLWFDWEVWFLNPFQGLPCSGGNWLTFPRSTEIDTWSLEATPLPFKVKSVEELYKLWCWGYGEKFLELEKCKGKLIMYVGSVWMVTWKPRQRKVSQRKKQSRESHVVEVKGINPEKTSVIWSISSCHQGDSNEVVLVDVGLHWVIRKGNFSFKYRVG